MQALSHSLQEKQGINNVPKLVAVLSRSTSEGVLKAAIQGLKLFFVESSQDLAPKRLQEQQQQQPDAGTHEIYRQWLRRHYNAYISALITLITSKQHAAAVQTAATAAVMEAVRSEAGVGVFANDLYTRLLAAVATAEGVKPEVYTLLFNRYFHFADVRYYSLWSVRSLALKHSAAPAPTTTTSSSKGSSKGKIASASAAAEGIPHGDAAPPPAKALKRSSELRREVAGAAAAAAVAEVDNGGSEAAAGRQGHLSRSEGEDVGEGGSGLQGEERPGAAGGVAGVGAGEQGGSGAGYACVPVEDLCRNLFDIMGALPETLPSSGGGEAANVADLQSWCGAAEVGAMAATSDKNESARARRKRKMMEAPQQQAAQAHAAASEQRAMWANAKAQRRMFSDAWLALLQLPIPQDLYHKVLLRLHANVIPNMMAPNMLADFLTYSLNQGGLTGMLALQGIFILVTQHGLEYPAFYRRLYNLLNQDAFAAKHRSQFFALADVFMSSPLVPAYTMASFAKRLARLALSAPPAGAMIAIAFIHNLLRRHPSCMVLLHNPRAQTGSDITSTISEPLLDGGEQQQAKHGEGVEASGGAELGSDPYDPQEEDPAKTRAVESSLWELQALRNHYCPQVAAFCSVLDKDLSDRTKTSEVDISPLLIQSYSTLINQELERRLKQVPVAFYQDPPRRLFDINSYQDFGISSS